MPQPADDRVPVHLVTITSEITADGVTETGREITATAWVPASVLAELDDDTDPTR